MENVPLKPGDESDKEVSAKKGKKSAKTLGIFAMEPKESGAKGSETADDIWQKLSLTKRQSGQSEPPVPLAAIETSSEARSVHGAEVSETEAPLETLSPEERQYITHEIVSETQKHSAVEDTAEAPDISDVEHVPESVPEAVTAFRDRIVNGGLDAEQAFAETLRDLGVDAEPVATEAIGTTPDTALPSMIVSTEAEASGLPNDSHRDATAAPERLEVPAAEPIGANDPEQPIVSDVTSRDGPPSYSSPTWAGEAPSYQSPIAPNSPSVAKEYVPYYNSRDVMGAALIGGLIGYLIGRRRGRIKTERKLLPIQKKLEKQVKGLQEDIQYKEVYIRKIARQRREDRQNIYHMERDKLSQEAEARQVAMEANQLHGKKVAPERIGHMLMTVEDQPIARTKPDKREKPIDRRLTDKRVETMSRAELLELSGRVNVENTNLRHIYETHLVGEQGLRRLINEYMHGGNVQRILREELAEHERDFERDPILRDRAKASGGAASSETLGQLLEKAEALTDHEAKEELAVLKARHAHQESQQAYQQQRRRVLDVSIVAAIAVLFVLVVTLLITTR